MSVRGALGVLTFHRCINYGSYWQARCLVEGLRSLGHPAVILDHDSPAIRRAEHGCARQPCLPLPAQPDDAPLYRRKIRRFLRAISELPRSRRFALEDPSTMDEFNTVVVGSDEVWNLSHPWYGGCAMFFGRGVRAGRLVAYAASCGNHETDRPLDEHWSGPLRRFDALAVRDANSRRVIANTLGFSPEIVLDPCLAFPPRPTGVRPPVDPPFLLVYGHGFSAEFAGHVRRWARARGRRVVSIGYRNDWADVQLVGAGPPQFVASMASCDAVATNFFHGCVFALRFERPFVCEPSPYRRRKIADLLELVGDEARQTTPGAPADAYGRALSQPPDDAVLRTLRDLRRSSHAWLERALPATEACPCPAR